MSVGPADPKSLQALPTWVVGAPIAPAVRIGKLLQGEYLINSILGEGELGVTYEAENARLKRKFAVLMLKRELKPTQGMMLQVRDDLRRAEPLQSVGIMPVKMIVDHMMIPGFATELLEGETLRARLSRGPLPPERALATVLAVARAMDALHKAGSVHGDLRPENIFLVRPGAKSSFAGRVMVVEHSLHALRRRSQGLDDQLPLYKLMYRPPECLAGERGPHIGGDVFVLGAILQESLTGRPAFYDEVADFVIDNLNQPPKPIPENPATGLTAELAATLSVLVASACARDPEVRTPDMAEIILAIEQVVKGAGLTLPQVITEEPQAAPTAPATPTASRMNRLLHRMSGVFPQVRLPPVTEPVSGSQPAPAAKSATSLPRGSAPPEAAAPAAVTVRPQSTTMPPIVAPRTKVTMLLQKLSGVFPVLQVSPEGNLETLSSSDPKIAGPALANQQAQAARTPAPVATASSSAITQPALAALPSPTAAATTSAEAAKSPAGSAAAPASESGAALTPVADAAPPAAVAGSPQSDKAVVAEKAAAPVSETAPSAVSARPEAAAVAEPVVAAAPASPAVSPPPAVSAIPPISDTPTPAKSSEVAKALALLRLQQQARATGQPVDLQRAGLAPATPEAVVPAFMAAPPAVAATPAVAPTAVAPTAVAPSAAAAVAPPVAAAPAAAPSAPSSPAAAANSGQAGVSAAAQRPTAPPVAADASGAHKTVTGDTSSALAAAQAAADQGWMGLVADSVTPAVSYPPSSLSPTHERPAAAPPTATDISLDSTLEPDDLAAMADATARSPGRKGHDTLSEIPTRPAVAGLEPIAPRSYNEAKTQPALRSLPITEQATQAKLSPDLFNLATSIKAPAPDFSDMATAAAMPNPGVPLDAVTQAVLPTVPVAATPAVASAAAVISAAHAAPTPAVGTPAPQFESLRDLEAVSILEDAPVAPAPAATDKSTPSRPPRVSQLIKALQQGQIDQFQALQQASGTPSREPPAAAPSPAPPPPPPTPAPAAQPAATGSQAVVGPVAASPSGPTPQGRVSPGLMALAPPPAANGDSPWGTSSQQVVAMAPKVPAPVGLRGFLLRNQEVAAGLIGALFVLLIGIAFLLFR